MNSKNPSSFNLSAFGDEISPDFANQLSVLDKVDIDRLDLRSIDNTNIVYLEDSTIQSVQNQLADAGISVTVIGSPVGKVDITGGAERSATRTTTGRDATSFEDQLDRLDRALDLADMFDANYVRVFSYYTPDGERPESYRDEIVRRTEQKVERAAEADVVLLHENVPGIYGASPQRLKDLLTTIDSPHFRAIFDAANLYKYGSNPFPDAFHQLDEYIECIHIKDAAKMADGTVEMVPIDEGEVDLESILRAYREVHPDGWLSLEPHLSLANPENGLTGSDAFVEQVHALRALLEQVE